MRENEIEAAFKQIGAYFSGTITGYPFLVNTEDMDIYSEIVRRLEADKTKKCVYVSNSCQKNGLPNIEKCLLEICGCGNHVLIGSSQALMLKSEEALEHQIDIFLGQSISGHAMILLNHSKKYIEKYEKRDPRIAGRVLLIDGRITPLPKIVLVREEDKKLLGSIQHLLSYMEKLNGHTLLNQREIYVKTKFGRDFFSKAIYQIVESEGAYASLAKSFIDIAGATEITYGTEQQWKWLSKKMLGKSSLSMVIYDEFGMTDNLELILADVFLQKGTERFWLYWLALKAFGTKNEYLRLVSRKSQGVNDFEEHIYLDLADEEIESANFEKMYLERKRILNRLPENLPLITKYCGKLGKYEKNAVFYLTDSSTNEEMEFIKYLSQYDFSDNEVYNVAKHFSPMLEKYLQQFTFDSVNTKVSESDSELWEVLSQYFQSYKIQKITNHIYPEFLAIVENFAVERPYNKLRPRSNIISQMDKEGAELFFFDALGVEYLSFIQAKCEEYGLISEIFVGRGELPSITVNNKEFIQYFNGKFRKISDLDELKHHSQIFDYEKRKEPLHVFRELDIIDGELRQIQSLLVQGNVEKAVIVSDHGASRLAVINEKENNSPLELDEKGEHSGRCCLVESDPKIPYAAYEEGFAVLANYERFKGGRKANVEVHGGATLEEVVVPIIILMKKPENVEYCFTDPVIKLKQKDVATLTLYCNISMNHPVIHVDQKIYEGEFGADKRHAKFVMPELKRSREYIAEVYDGEKNLSITLKFRIQKTLGQENDLLGF